MSDEQQDYISEKSYLVADCGQALTKVALFDAVAGSYRLVAHTAVRTTAGEPWLDIRVGLRNAVQHIGEITGRTLLDTNGNIIRPSLPDGSGVDFYTTVVSSAPLLRTILGGLFHHVSIAKAHHVMLTNYTDVIDLFSLSDSRDKGAQIAAIVQNRPDLIMITGGTNDGARDRLLELVDTIYLGVEEVDPEWRPTVIFAGNESVQETVKAQFDAIGNLHVAPNLQPELGDEQLEGAVELLGEMYRLLKINQVPGIREVNDWSHTPASSTANALSTIVSYLATSRQQSVFCVDIGSGSLTMIAANDERVKTAVNTKLGMGKPLANLPQQIDLTEINRWLPSSIDEQEIIDFIYQRALHPQTVATLEKEILLEQALARELLKQALTTSAEAWGWAHTNALPQTDSIIVRGSIFAHAPRYGPAILTLLDALLPTGIFSLFVDKYDIMPLLGKLAAIDPLVVVQTIENDFLPLLAWVIAPEGSGKVGQRALTVQFDSSAVKLPDVEVEFGSIELLPLPTGTPAKITIKPSRRLNVGAGMGKTVTQTIYGGLFGLVIDARGRPLTTPQRETEQHGQIRQWLREVGG